MNKKIANIAGRCLWLLPCMIMTLSACSKQTVTTAEGSGKIVAVVNGKPIFESRVEKGVAAQLRKYKNPQPGLINATRKSVLYGVIDSELLLQASQSLEIPDIDEKVEKNFQDYKKEMGSEERFQYFLKRDKMTVEQRRMSLRKKFIKDEYLKSQGVLEPHIPEEIIKAFYKQKNSMRGKSLQLKHILLIVPKGAKLEEKEKIRQKAEKLRQDLIEGADFAELARKYSDAAGKDAGGDAGFTEIRKMPPDFVKAVSSLKENDLSEVFEGKYGYNILKLISTRPAGPIPYEEVRDFFKKYLQSQRSPKMVAAHIEELRSQASIEIK